MSVVSMHQAPEDYHELFHPAKLVKKIALHIALAIVIVMAIGWLATLRNKESLAIGSSVAVIVLPVLVVLAYRQYWFWKHQTIDCNARNAQLTIADPINRLLFIRGSSPDRIDLKTATIESLQQSFLQTYIPWLQNSQSVRIMFNGESIVLNDVVHAEKFEAIQDYVRSLEKQGTDQNDQIITLLEQNLATNTELVAQGKIIVGLLQQLAGNTPVAPSEPISEAIEASETADPISDTTEMLAIEPRLRSY